MPEPGTTTAPKALPGGAGSSARRVRHPGRVAIVVGGLLLVAVIGAAAIGTADTSDVKSALPDQVKSVSPRPNSIVQPQTPITVDLRDDLTGDLRICGPAKNECTGIPFDQVQFVKGLGQITFIPSEDSDFQEFSPGPVYVTVAYRSQADAAQDVGSYSWSFVSKS